MARQRPQLRRRPRRPRCEAPGLGLSWGRAGGPSICACHLRMALASAHRPPGSARPSNRPCVRSPSLSPPNLQSDLVQRSWLDLGPPGEQHGLAPGPSLCTCLAPVRGWLRQPGASQGAGNGHANGRAAGSGVQPHSTRLHL